MITYKGVRIHYEPGSLYVAPKYVRRVRHYPGTNRSKASSLGQEATQITCLAVSQTPMEKLILEQLINSPDEGDLLIYDQLYTQVIVSPDTNRWTPETPDGSVWNKSITFICLSPKPRNPVTREVLY